ncbi:MAG: ABC transporter permease [Actinomycetota bacterium]|nr:ABC transporter permease [Actinomycetota bacterium]
MWRFALVRTGQLLVTLFLASVAVFLVIEHAPGDPAQVQLGLSATPAEIAVERRKLGLDASVMHRYVVWLGQALHLDLGRSFATGLPVTRTIVTAFGYTLRLDVLAIVLGIALGLPLGIAAALRRGSRLDAGISAFAALGLSVPVFAMGTLLILVFAVHFKVMPAAGAGVPGQSVLSSLRYLVLPAATLAIPFAAVLARYLRVELGEAMEQPYVLTARSLGLRRRTVVVNAWRNAMIPTITVMGIQVGRLLAGAIITETVFSYPGIGYLTVQSIQSLDYPVVEGVLLLGAAVFLLVMFVVDVVIGFASPRMRIEGA